MSLTFKQELAKQNVQAHHDLYKQTNQAAIDFSLKTLSSLFLLNGAAATALLAQNYLPLKWPALAFGVAALLAVIAMGISYIFTLYMGETFRIPVPKDRDGRAMLDEPWVHLPSKWSHKFLILAWGFGEKFSFNQHTVWRIRLIAFSAIPAGLFLAGLFWAGWLLSCSR